MKLVIPVPHNEWITANGRYHHHQKAKMTRALKGRAFLAAKAQKLVVETPTFVAVKVGYPTAAKADPDNAQPTVKALIDGVVEAGALPDDDSRHVVGILYQRGPKCKKGVHVIELIFTSQLANF